MIGKKQINEVNDFWSTDFGNRDSSEGDNIPLICLSGRIAEQKGFDYLLAVINQIMALNDGKIQLIVQGLASQGPDMQYIDEFKKIQNQYKGKFKLVESFDKANVANPLIIASDMFLMPSKFEPCGLSNIENALLGCAIISTKVGGLTNSEANWHGKDGLNLFEVERTNADITTAENRGTSFRVATPGKATKKNDAIQEIKDKSTNEDINQKTGNKSNSHFKLC